MRSQQLGLLSAVTAGQVMSPSMEQSPSWMLLESSLVRTCSGDSLGSVIYIVNVCFDAVASRGDSAVLCHVLAHAGGAISLMSITHPLDSLRKAQVINTAETAPH